MKKTNEMKEEWRPVPQYEGMYEVSSLGRIKSLTRVVKGSRGSKSKSNGRILKQGKHSHGYRRVSLCNNGVIKYSNVHRLVAIAFIDNPDNLPVVNHIDNDPSNNVVSNLEWTTFSGNTIHAYKSGRMTDNSGENNGMAKLSISDVKSIVKMRFIDNLTLKQISEKAHLNIQSVCDIVYGRRWASVTGIKVAPKGTKPGPRKSSITITTYKTG